MKLATVASYAVAFAGLGMMAVAIAPVFGATMLYRDARRTLINLLRTDPARAEVLCRTSPGTFMEAVASAIKTAAPMGTTDPQMIVAGTRPGYDAIASMVALKWKGLFGKGKLAAMAMAGAFALALSSGTNIVPFVIAAVLVGGGLLWIVIQRAEVDRSLVLARAEILPEVERMFAEGRYRPPG